VIRKAAWKLAPGLMADRARRYESKLRDEWGLPVASGPFVGMRYPRDLRGVDHPLDKLVGCYELEIQPAVERLLQQSVFVDLGSADGYYAVGAALRGCDVRAYELSRSARRLSRKIARMNGVEIQQHGRARADFPLDAGVLCDIEGAEGDFFTPELCSRITGPVVIETHEHYRPGVTELLAARFQRPHEVLRPAKPRAGDTRWLVVAPV
jgi:hypothetical protein